MKNELTAQNRKVVDDFFVALETQKFEILKDVFAKDGRQLGYVAQDRLMHVQ